MFPIRLLFRNYLLKRVTRREFHAQRPAMAKVSEVKIAKFSRDWEGRKFNC